MAQVARISGPLLAANLKRTQSNLAFETDLLYIGALNGRVGIRTSSPNAELNVNGQIESPNVYATRLTGGNVRFSTTGAEAVVGDINLNGVLEDSEKEAIGMIRYVYLGILISHILMSIIVIPFVLRAFYLGLAGQIEKHLKIVKN